ncbi:MAG: serine hydrolase [Vicingaceae bacterium]
MLIIRPVLLPKAIVKSLLVLFVILGITAENTLTGQTLYFPPTGSQEWDTLSPSDLGYCDEKIDSLFKYLEDNDSKGFLLLKDGKMVLEKYFGTFTKDSLWYWASAGKTLTAALVGIAQQENYLDINDTSSTYLGKGWTSLSPQKEALITIKDQLSMTSGLDDASGNPDCTFDTCLNYLSDAGSRWAYHNAPYTLLDSVIFYATNSTINNYLFAKIRNPIGMNGAYVKLGFNNVYFSNMRSMARFGILLLSQGIWNGNAIFTDSTYFTQMVNSSQNLNLSYGYLTWLNGKNSFMVPQSQIVFPGTMNPDAPADMFAAMGKNGQLLNVVPSLGLIWVRMGNPPSSGGGLIGPVFNNEIWKRINALPCALGIKTLTLDPDILIYPNPSKGKLRIQATNQASVEVSIIDSFGRIIQKENLNGPVAELSIAGKVSNGLYILKIEGKGMIHTEKLVIDKQ